MSNFFENVKNYLFKRRKSDRENPKEKDLEKENLGNPQNLKGQKRLSQDAIKERQEDETSILLEDDLNKHNNEMLFNKRKILSKSLVQNRLMPLLYLTFSFSTIIFCFLSEPIMKNKENYLTIDANKGIKMFDFFKLYNINPLVFHIFFLSTGLVGIITIYLVQNTLLIKYLGHTRTNTIMQFIEIYLTSFFGFFAQAIHIISGMIFFFNSFDKFDAYTKSEIKISIHQLLFFLEIFFTSIYGIFICLTIIKVNKNDLLDEENNDTFMESFNYNYENNNNTQKIPDNISSKWLNYIMVSLIYLIFFSLSYILILFMKISNTNKQGNINGEKEVDYFKMNQNYLIIFLPYLIYILHTVFYGSLYGVLKYSSTCHVEFTSQNVYDKSHKNML